MTPGCCDLQPAGPVDLAARPFLFGEGKKRRWAVGLARAGHHRDASGLLMDASVAA